MPQRRRADIEPDRDRRRAYSARKPRRGGRLLEPWLDALDATGRWALLKLVTGSLRIGVSARLAKTALAEWSGVGDRPYRGGLARARRPISRCSLGSRAAAPPPTPGTRRPSPVDAGPAARRRRSRPALIRADYFAEWKWDGIRVQLVARGGERGSIRVPAMISGRLFPIFCAAMPDEVMLDGELLVMRGGEAGPVQRSAAAAQPQDREREDVARLSGGGPALRHPARGR